MTRKEAIKLLTNIRVYVGTKSEEIQRKLFEFGFEWNNSGCSIQNKSKPFLYTDYNGYVKYGESMTCFNESSHREMSAEDILSIKINCKYEFKPFDKVLVRDEDTDIWRCSLYSHVVTDSEYSYICLSGSYSQCIPFEGNEYLVGTRNNSYQR